MSAPNVNEVTALRIEFQRRHFALLAAEDHEIFHPSDESHRATAVAREAQAPAYIAYITARGEARAANAVPMGH